MAPASGLALLALGACFWQFDRTLYFRFLAFWALPTLNAPFADWYAVVALMHCAARGIDVYVASGCGVFSYSPLWSWARWIPESWAWRSAAGLSIDCAFFASLWFVFRPRGWGEAALFTLACISPAAAYAAERANVDLILLLMMIPAASLAAGGPVRRASAYGIIGLAGLLKFYPFAALVIALRETTCRFLVIALLAFAAMAVVLFAIRGDLAALAAGMPGGGGYDYGAFGARNFPYLLFGPTPSPIARDVSLAFVSLGCLAASLAAARGRGLARAASRLDDRDAAALVIGAAIIVGCFFAGESNNYRAIFLIPVVAGLLSLRRTADDARTRRLLVWLTVGALALTWFRPAQLALYPGGKLIPGFRLLAVEMTWLRELIWWWEIAWLLALLMSFATRSKSLAFLRPWLVDGLGIGAFDSRL